MVLPHFSPPREEVLTTIKAKIQGTHEPGKGRAPRV